VKKLNSNNQTSSKHQNAVNSKVNTIESEISLKSGDDYKMMDVSNLEDGDDRDTCREKEQARNHLVQ